ncbi:hypothetical protein NUU61_008190 [Penicillium alfredii]|uniref:Uncharacterized protein n=1 Tax=Penicillium alfredii TaxID=1506179 RepID=A0A9W9ERX0_9EURO|nr:uncharacterized protein NUU61_008190 [Penicillium alfredii]KAJ5086883.1 hypothetical protein NUU61_008190 [Penicillium alfredii]
MQFSANLLILLATAVVSTAASIPVLVLTFDSNLDVQPAPLKQRDTENALVERDSTKSPGCGVANPTSLAWAKCIRIEKHEHAVETDEEAKAGRLNHTVGTWTEGEPWCWLSRDMDHRISCNDFNSKYDGSLDGFSCLAYESGGFAWEPQKTKHNNGGCSA